MTFSKGFITGSELAQKTYAPITMLTDFFPACGFMLLSGVPGAGKTEFLMQQAYKIAQIGKVLFFCSEGGESDFHSRFKAYFNDNKIFDNLIYIQNRWPNLSEREGLAALDKVASQFAPKAIFFDPGPDAFGEENEAKDLKEPLRILYERIHSHYKICLVCTWHPSKDQTFSNVYSIRGSTAIPVKADLVYGLTLLDSKRTLHLHKMRPSCPNLTQGQRWNIEQAVTESGKDLIFRPWQKASVVKENQRTKQIEEALSSFSSGLEYTATEIKTAIINAAKNDMSYGTASNILNRMIMESKFQLSQPKSGSTPAKYIFHGVT